MSHCRHFYLLFVALLVGAVSQHGTKADSEACFVESLRKMVAELNVTTQEKKAEVAGLKNEVKNEREKRIKLEEENAKLRNKLQTNNVRLNDTSISLTQQVQDAKCQLQTRNRQIRSLQNVSLQLQAHVTQLQQSNCVLNRTAESLTEAVAYLGRNETHEGGAFPPCSNCTEGMMTSNDSVVLGNSSSSPESTCKEIALRYNSSSHNGKYWIKPSSDDPPFQVYCDANEGWSLIMKIDGKQQTFDYDSDLWSNKNTFQLNNTDLDDKETKLASYWTLPFTELRLGMKKVNGTIRWITFSYSASSLHSLIADGQYRSTSIGKTTWRSLLPNSSLQTDCNRDSTQEVLTLKMLQKLVWDLLLTTMADVLLQTLSLVSEHKYGQSHPIIVLGTTHVALQTMVM
ncbi:uncharacterized protein LOC134186951 isoform X2 [Corticium candelabrum]|uniref:uncharacterized protein LOC134186951 isoform X2 n=1 Tax=Corticium candelabrum TaxID=121492 RepID=UPI002E25731C|nr:uncharacterized protein LOC134186951 isoform X2 [Corticium candelabrum]